MFRCYKECLQVLKTKLSIEKHDQGVEIDVWLILNLCLDFHANSNE